MKKVHVLEVQRYAKYYAELGSDMIEAFSKLPKDLQLKHQSELDAVMDSLREKINECDKYKCVWEGVIARNTIEELIEDGYKEYYSDPTSPMFVVSEAEIEDDAVTWVGYTKSHLVKKESQMLFNAWFERRQKEGKRDE